MASAARARMPGTAKPNPPAATRKLVRAEKPSPMATRLDWTAVLAVACLACGWFWMSSLTTDLIAVRLHFHFYDVLTLLRNPRSILTGAGGDEGSVNAW